MCDKCVQPGADRRLRAPHLSTDPLVPHTSSCPWCHGQRAPHHGCGRLFHQSPWSGDNRAPAPVYGGGRACPESCRRRVAAGSQSLGAGTRLALTLCQPVGRATLSCPGHARDPVTTGQALSDVGRVSCWHHFWGTRAGPHLPPVVEGSAQASPHEHPPLGGTDYLSAFSRTSATLLSGFRSWRRRLCCSRGRHMFHCVAHTAWMGPGSPRRTARCRATSSLWTMLSCICTRHTGRLCGREANPAPHPGSWRLGRLRGPGPLSPALQGAACLRDTSLKGLEWAPHTHTVLLSHELLPSKGVHFSSWYSDHCGRWPALSTTQRSPPLSCATCALPTRRALVSHLSMWGAGLRPMLPQSPLGLPADPKLGPTASCYWQPQGLPSLCLPSRQPMRPDRCQWAAAEGLSLTQRPLQPLGPPMLLQPVTRRGAGVLGKPCPTLPWSGSCQVPGGLRAREAHEQVREEHGHPPGSSEGAEPAAGAGDRAPRPAAALWLEGSLGRPEQTPGAPASAITSRCQPFAFPFKLPNSH